jgi:serine/threonine protein kinase/tetratricopeptide (TPR) repeat protein
VNEQTLFAEALERTDPHDRAAFLGQACQGDPALRERIERLLAQHEHAGAFLESPPLAQSPTIDGQQTERCGTVLAGRYELLEPIGEGGMGTVWMAQQQEPVKRLVAVKLIKAGMDSRPVLARFEAERQALALMDHPNIAKVHDAGVSADGRPYFVMELVKGVPITRYCDEHHLTPRQRLELFVPVCQAIQHAHQKGIIHRDLKPSNILVALYDDRPVPKVIDFGVAKATGPQLTEETLHTGFGTVVGTVEYMSPEQASFNNLDVDTRSDVYALGVLLYELLAGSPPFSREELERVGMLEMLRLIREEEPSRPSTKLSTAESLPTLAANRGTEPAKLTKLIRGELDWIAMKCLEKDRTRRYETANSLALDVQRYLNDEPVLACPPSAGYRLRKFVRRHRGPVLAAGLVLLTLVVGIIGTTWGLIWADQARRKANTQEDIANANLVKARTEARRAEDNFDKVVSAVDEWLKPAFGEDTPLQIKDELIRHPVVVELTRVPLERALRFFEDFVEQKGSDPETRLERAQAHLQIGRIRFRMLGAEHSKKNKEQLAKAEGAYRKGIDLLDELISDQPGEARPHVEQAKTCIALAQALQLQANYLAADIPWADREAQQKQEREKREQAEEIYRRALAIYAQLAQEHPDEPEYRYQLAMTYKELPNRVPLYQVNVALEAQGEVIAILEKLVAEHPAEARYPLDLAEAHHARMHSLFFGAQRRDDGLASMRRAIDVLETAAAACPMEPRFWERLAQYSSSLGGLLNLTNRRVDAEVASRRAVATWEKYADKFPMSHRQRHAHAKSYYSLGEIVMGPSPDEAAQIFARSLRLFEALAAEIAEQAWRQHSLDADIQHLATRLHQVGRWQEEEAALRVSVAFNEQESKQPWAGLFSKQGSLSVRNSLGTLLMSTGRFKDAEAEFTQAINNSPRVSVDFSDPFDSPDYLLSLSTIHNNLGAIRTRTGRAEEAEQAIRQSITTLQKVRTEFKFKIPEFKKRYEAMQPSFADTLATYQKRLGNSLRDSKQISEAENAYRVAIAIRQKEVRPSVGSPGERINAEQLADLHSTLAEVLLKAGKERETERALREAAEAWEKLSGVGYGQFGRNELAIVYYRLGLLLEKAGRSEEAQEARCRSGKLGPDPAEAHRQAAWLQASSSERVAWWYLDPTRAVELARKAVELTPASGLCWKTLGLAHYRVGNWKEAIAAQEKANELRQGGGPAEWFILAMAHWQLGSKDEARTWYDRSVGWMEKHPDGTPQRGVEDRPEAGSLRRFRSEAAALMGIPEPWPKIEEWRVWRRLGHAYAAEGRWSEAAGEFAKVIAASPDDPQLWHHVGLLRLYSGDTDGYRKLCADMLRRFGQAEDQNALHFLVLTCVLGENGVADLQPVVRAAEKLAPEGRKKWLLGMALCRAGRLEEALQKLNEAEKLAGLRQWNWLFLSISHGRLGQTEEARRWLAKADDSWPKLAKVLHWTERLQWEVLRREAQALFNLKPPPKEVEKGSPQR